MNRELTRDELSYLHHKAAHITATYREFFPDAPRPAPCVFNAPKAKPGTLAGLQAAR